MAGEDRTRMPPDQEPIVRRRNRDEPPVAMAGPRAPGRPAPGEDDDTGFPAAAPAGPAPSAGGAARPPVESYSGGAPRDRMVEDARFGELYVLFIINLLLGIITLGIYRFWGKTRIRKYVWSHIAFRRERFEYSGTGGELFIGFLIVLAIFGPPFFGFYLWIQLDPPIPRGDMAEFVTHLLFLYLALFALILLSFYFTHVAIFAAYRYRITRTLWHGIRGTVDGNAWKYGFLGFGLSLLNGMTLGWTQPWAHTLLINYRLTRTKIGTQQVKGEMTTEGLYGPFAIAWVISAAVAIVAIFIIAGVVAGMQTMRNPESVEAGAGLVILVLAYLLVPMTWLITVNWYRAALIRKVATTFTVDRLKFAFPIRGGRLFWFNFSNGLILLFTLGLLYPYVILRYARLITHHLEIEGELDYTAWQQSDDWRPSTGEGMAEFFGIGVI